MKELDIQLKAKPKMVKIFAATSFLTCLTILVAISLTPFGSNNNLNMISLLPFVLFAIFILSVLIFTLNINKKNGQGRNVRLGNTLLVSDLLGIATITILYLFPYSISPVNTGLHLISGLIWVMISLPAGLLLRYGIE